MTSNRRRVKRLMERTRHRAKLNEIWFEEFLVWLQDYRWEEVQRQAESMFYNP